MNRGQATEEAKIGSAYRTGLLLVGVVALLIPILGGWTQFFQSYLYAWVFCMTLALGCLGYTLLIGATRAIWSRGILRIVEAGSRTLPFLFVAFLPILIITGLSYGGIEGLHRITPFHMWLHPAQGDHIVQEKTLYLNFPFWAIRAVVYFAIWITLATLMTRWSVEQDRTGEKQYADRRANVGAAGLVLFFLTVTFAFTDWVMSLEPHWFSTIYGLWFAVGCGLGAISVVALLIVAWRDRRPYTEVVNPQLTRDVGNLMLTTTMLWAYTSLSQFLIIWAGNLPEEAVYYTRRFQSGWLYLGTVLIIFQFFAPFLLLLSGRTKRVPTYLAMTAGLILMMRVLDLAWIVLPAFPAPPNVGLALMAVVGMAALWGVSFFTELPRYPLLPRHEEAPGREVLEHA